MATHRKWAFVQVLLFLAELRPIDLAGVGYVAALPELAVGFGLERAAAVGDEGLVTGFGVLVGWEAHRWETRQAVAWVLGGIDPAGWAAIR